MSWCIRSAERALGIGLAVVNRWLSVAIYVTVALMWLIPDRRFERWRKA